MKIIQLIQEFTNTFNKTFNKNLNPLNLESKIRDVGDTFTLKLYESFLNYFDEQFKISKERKSKYNIKQTRKRTLITSIGLITINSTSYIDKKTKQYYVPLRDVLHLNAYQRLTNEAEYQLIKYAMNENMSQSAHHALRNIIISRSTVSKNMAKLDGSIIENIAKCNSQPDILYIEMDEIHANLQHGGNKICPCAIVHEGHDDFSNNLKRKALKNVHYFASAKLNYEQLWEVIFDYVNKKYDISKFKIIFISGDGASGIKNYTNCFSNAIFVLDKFHYKGKHLKYIFKKDKDLSNIADDYIRNGLIDDFKKLVNIQIEKYPNQKKYMREHMNYIINNIDGIKNQNHPLYECSCSMEEHVNQGFARYITSSPFGFSEKGLENKLKLIVANANKHELTMEDYYNLKFGTNSYEDINIKINKICNIKYDQTLSSNHSSEYNINTKLPIFDSPSENNKLKELINIRQEFYVI